MKKGYLVLMFLVLSLLLSPAILAQLDPDAPLAAVPAAPSPEDAEEVEEAGEEVTETGEKITETIGNVFEKIIYLGNLEFLIEKDPTATEEEVAKSRVVGFTRILLAILIFTLFYALTGALSNYINRNIGIAISVVLALISVIGIPDEVIALIIGSYGIVSAFILLAVVFAPLVYFIFFTPTDTRAMAGAKLAVLAVVAFLFGLTMKHLKGLEAIAVDDAWKGFVKFAGNFEAYAWTAVVIMGLYLLWKLFAPRGSTNEEWGLKQGDKIKEWLTKRIKSEVKRAKTRTLYEYSEEEKELNALENIPPLLERLNRMFKDTYDLGNITSKSDWKGRVTDNLKTLEKAADDAKDAFTEVVKATHKQQREAKRLIRDLRRAKDVDSNVVTQLQTEVRTILAKHRDAKNALNEFIRQDLGNIKENHKLIDDVVKRARNFPLDNTTTNVTPQHTILEILNGLGGTIDAALGINGNIREAIEAEEEAIKNLQAFIANIEKEW